MTVKKKADQVVPLTERMALTVAEVAATTGFSYPFIDAQISAGNLKCCDPSGAGRAKRIRPADIDAWLTQSPWEPATSAATA
ncbi:helix-turn-helix domain-containing protein [Nocardia salmonicida]